jgi:hypothetical protein
VIEGEGLVLTPSNGKTSVTFSGGESSSKSASEGKEKGGATIFEGEGIVIRPSPKTQPTEAEGNDEEAEASKEGETQIINIGGVPVEVSGSEISLNGKPLDGNKEEEEKTSTTINIGGTPFELFGSDIVVNGKPIVVESKEGGE